MARKRKPEIAWAVSPEEAAGGRGTRAVGEAVFKTQWQMDELANKQRTHTQFRGPKGPRSDALNGAIDTALAELGPKAPARRVLEAVRGYDFVEHVDEDDHIYWRASKGRQGSTSFKRFQDRVSARRRKLIQK